MNPARIAELLEPFLRGPNSLAEHSGLAGLGHSEVVAARDFNPAQMGDAPVTLSPAQLQHISTYIDILLRWNARMNLTAVRDPEEIVTRHFGESLFAARHLFPPGSFPAASGVQSVADVGSGAGFPGLPIKLWAPRVALTLIESNHKKATFLREVTRALTLTDVDIQNVRAEALTANQFDTVTLRAVERFQTILPLAASLVAPAGRLTLLIGAAQQDQATATLPKFTWQAPVPIPHSRARVLLIGHRN
jgi:16S rRNA (guanine527-N7)-methyltransferase